MAKQTRQSGKSARRGSDRKNTDDHASDGLGAVMDGLPTGELKDQTRDLMAAVGERAMAVAKDKIGGLSDRLVDLVEHGSPDGSGGDGESGGGGPLKHLLKAGASAAAPNGESPVKHLLKAGASGAKEMVMDKIGGGSGGGGGKGKARTKNTIIEQIDVGVPVRVAYDQWTQFQDFPKFTRRIENVDQKSDEKVTWKAGIYFSHRTWQSTIVDQVPDEHIVWRSQGEKGYIDGTVTFHELAPSLTKILLVLEYHPQGLFERTGNAFRSQRRRARLELHQFDRHIMRQTILEQEELEGWRGEIRDGEVVKSHEDALEEERSEDEDDADYDEDEPRGEDEDYADEDDETDEDEDDDLDAEYDDEDQDEDDDREYRDEDEDDYDDEEAEDDEAAEDADRDRDDDYENEYDDGDYAEDDEDADEDDEEPDDEYDDEFEDEYEDEDEDGDSVPDDQDGARRTRSRGRRREPALSR